MSKLRDHKKLFVFGKRFAGFAGMLLILLCVFSCSNLMVNDGGSLVIAIPGARAASASSYTIELKGSNGTTQTKTVAGGTTAQFDDLDPDTYTISVKGTNESVVVLYGTSSATVSAGATASATVKLGAVANDLNSLQQAVTAGGIVYIGSSIDVTSSLTVNTDVTLLPAYKNVTLTKAGDIELISVTAGKLTVGGNDYTITLDGDSSNITSTKNLIKVNGAGSTIYLNRNSVVMNNAGTGVSITGANALNSGKAFGYLNGGTISNNKSGGVSLSDADFVMNDGLIDGNSGVNGAGVSMNSTTGIAFIMKGGTISDNQSPGDGGAIYGRQRCSFTMEGGTIKGNSATGNGGGVYLSNGTFIMNGGTIIDNNVSEDSSLGYGVYFSDGDSGDLKFSGNPVIDKNNNVHYVIRQAIKISGPLTGATQVATITFDDYGSSYLVLEAENGVTLTEDVVEKFAVTPDTDGKKWTIDVSGYLKEQ